MRTLWLSLLILGVTAALQRRVHALAPAPTPRLTYGWGRAEDIAGLIVVGIILFSALYAGYEAIDRLIHPEAPLHLLATALAGLAGFLGNEWVAVYRIRSGQRLGSAALIADGYHARVDGFTSLAVVIGVSGVAVGVEQADAIVGLLISAAIMRIVWRSTREIGLRAMDGIAAETTDAIRRSALGVPGCSAVADVRARWLGHVIRAELQVVLDDELDLERARMVCSNIREAVIHDVEHVNAVAVELAP